MRFTSIHIAPRDPDDAQLRQFLACFAQERAHAANTTTPRLYHLFLASFASAAQPRRARESQAVRAGDGAAGSEMLAFHRDAAALVELVAPDLRTLVLVNDRGGALGLPPALAHMRAPQLRELTIIDPPGQLRFAPAHARVDEVGEEGPPCFPRLERLNMLGCHAVLDLRRWTHTAPRLTHLRITRLDDMSDVVENDLAQLLGASKYSLRHRDPKMAVNILIFLG